MITIAIVEDDKKSAKILQDYILRYSEEKQEPLAVECFENGLNFISDYKASCDIALMDIEMPHMNGLDTARKLREFDSQIPLIFITNMAKYAIRGYRVQALDYVLKPMKYEAFVVKMDKVKRLAEKKKDTSITIKSGVAIHRLRVSNILYVEVVQHLLIFHTEDGDFTTRGVLRDVEAILEENGFFKCNKCYLVNLRHVRSVYNGMALVGNDQLQVSRARKKAFAEAVADYIGNMQSI